MDPSAPPPSTATHQIADPQHQIVCARFRHPADWQAQSQVVWNFQNHSMPVKVFGRVFDPARPAMVEFFPAEGFYWIEPNMNFAQPGQENGGMTLMPPMPPMPPQDALIRWVLMKYRGQKQGQKVLDVRPMPQLSQMIGAKPVPDAAEESVCVRIEYSENGQTFEEEFYGRKVAYQGIPSYGAAGTLVQYNWGFDRLFSFFALKGELDANRNLYWQILRSFEVNPAWEQTLDQVLQALKAQFDQRIQAGYQQINAATQLSKQISAQNEAWLQGQQQRRDADWQSHQQRMQQNKDSYGAYSTNDAFGDMMMGRETYDDPYWQYGSQHSGYSEYVWTDKQGNYQYSDDANFDPNIGSNVDWELMKKKQIGDPW